MGHVYNPSVIVFEPGKKLEHVETIDLISFLIIHALELDGCELHFDLPKGQRGNHNTRLFKSKYLFTGNQQYVRWCKEFLRQYPMGEDLDMLNLPHMACEFTHFIRDKAEEPKN